MRIVNSWNFFILYFLLISCSIYGESSYFIGNNSAVPDYGNLTPNTNQYFSNEIDLMTGGLQLSEIDLKLPGKAGLDLVISRHYSSRAYMAKGQLNPLDGYTPFGHGLGGGWGLNVMMRAYFVMNGDNPVAGNEIKANDNFQKIVIQTVDGTSEYFYDETKKAFVSKDPNNHNRAFIFNEKKGRLFSDLTSPYSRDEKFTNTNPSIRFHTADGKIYFFRTTIFNFIYGHNDSYRDDSSMSLPWVHCMGFAISQIEVGLNKIKFEYEFKSSLRNKVVSSLKTLMGETLNYALVHIDNKVGDYQSSGANAIYIRRLTKITDTHNREFHFKYHGNSTLGLDNLDGVVREIQYKGIGGIGAKIQYALSNNQLSHVNHTGLVKQRYTYKTVNFDSVQKGSFLSSKENLLGAIINYDYTTKVEINKRGYAINQTMFPLVSKKEINFDGNRIIYNYDFTNRKSYTKPWISNKQYYYANATIKTPREINDQTSVFKDGKLIEQTEGILTKKYNWDYAKDRLLSEIHSSDRSMARYKKITYSNFNEFGLAKIQKTYIKDKNSNEKQVEEVKREYMPISNTNGANYNDSVSGSLLLPSRLKLETVTDIASGKQKNRYFTYYYSDPWKVYDGTSSSGQLLKSYVYNNAKRIMTEYIYNAGGRLKVNYTYTGGDNYSSLTIKKEVNNKITYATYEPYLGKLIEEVDINGNKTQYKYDYYGRLNETVLPFGKTEKTTYSSDFKTTTHTNYLGQASIEKRDSIGRVIEIDNPLGSEDIRFVYRFGNTLDSIYVRSTGGWDLKEGYGYDRYLRRNQTYVSNWGTSIIQHNDSSFSQTSTHYSGKRSLKSYDARNRLIQSKDLSNNQTTTFKYDHLDNIIETVDQRGIVFKTNYNEKSQVLNTYFPFKQGQSAIKKSENVYYDSGPVKKISLYDQLGTLKDTFESTYDRENRPVNIKHNGTSFLQYTYDENSSGYGNGQLTQVDSSASNTKYYYDKLGRITESKILIKPLSKTHSIKQTYDSSQRLSQLLFTDQKAITYKYNPQVPNQVQEVLYNGKSIVKYTYDSAGKLLSSQFLNGIKKTQEYYKEVLLKTLSYTKNDKNIYTQDHTYNNLGNIIKIVHSDYLQVASAESNLPAKTRNFTYTSKGELESVKIDGQKKYAYKYDNSGNLTLFESPENTNLESNNILIDDSSNQLQQKKLSDGRTLTYKYDHRGNVVEKRVLNKESKEIAKWAYTYTPNDQLSSVKKNDVLIAEYGYNHLRERIYSNKIGSSAHAGKRWYYWSNGKIIGEGHEKYGDHVVRYIYSGNQKIAMVRPKDLNDLSKGENIFYFINNAQGTPVLIVDEAGETESLINLNEFGNMNPSTFATADRAEINFTGKKLDLETGLYYFNQRYYDPEIGRFLTEDPAAQGLNLYSYAGNNPLTFIDPDGQVFFEALTYIGMAVGATIGFHDALNKGKNPFSGAYEGAVAGAVVGGTIGIVIDLAKGTWTTWDSPQGRAAFSTYIAAWNGTLAISGSAPVGGGGPPPSNDGMLHKGPGDSGGYSTDYDTSLQGQHDIARVALLNINGRSISENTEYGGIIYRDSLGKYGYTGPFRGNHDSFDIRVYRYAGMPLGSRAVASYHTHGGVATFFDRVFNNNPNIFSSQDINISGAMALDAYLGTPNGHFLYWNYNLDKKYKLGYL